MALRDKLQRIVVHQVVQLPGMSSAVWHYESSSILILPSCVIAKTSCVYSAACTLLSTYSTLICVFVAYGFALNCDFKCKVGIDCLKISK